MRHISPQDGVKFSARQGPPNPQGVVGSKTMLDLVSGHNQGAFSRVLNPFCTQFFVTLHKEESKRRWEGEASFKRWDWRGFV